MKRQEVVENVASRLYYSQYYRIFYLLIVFTSMFCIAWTLLNNGEIPRSNLFFGLEIGTSVLLLLEVFIRMMAQWKTFCGVYWNWVDIFIALLSLVSIVLYCFHADAIVNEIEQVATDTLLAIRNGVQYFRLLSLLRNRQHVRRESLEVDFDQVTLLQEKSNPEQLKE